jgi:hypothetical protein
MRVEGTFPQRKPSGQLLALYCTTPSEFRWIMSLSALFPFTNTKNPTELAELPYGAPKPSMWKSRATLINRH